MNVVLKILSEIWSVTVEMAPYLLFGFLMAGVLSVLISKTYVRQHLGGRGWMGAFKAALIGVPMPICSCGVIPLAASLRKHGASRGATASFLASTPQTGIDSLMITYALLGWVFALFRAVVAFLSGIACGVAVEAVTEPERDASAECTDTCCQQDQKPMLRRMLSYGFLTLPRNIAKAVTLGILLSGLISGLIPENFFADYLGGSPWAMLIMLIIGIPLYVCSSASVPIALAFIKAGISPGAALVFLITGPATNAATLTTLWQIIGRKQLAVFLITLAACALSAGFVMNFFTPHLGVEEQICHTEGHHGPFQLFAAIVLILILLKGLLPVAKR
jgi:uncharacterized membrane protein YraQ (UPF0718 family)